MPTINLINVFKDYQSGWVSISQDNKKVITSGKDLKTLLKKLQKLNNPQGYIMKAEKDYSNYVG